MTDAVGGRRGVATWLVVAVVTIVALGAYFRVDGLMSSLWIDEFGTFWVTEDRLSTTVARALQFQGQSPFYYLIVWIPLHLFGESELALRLPSLIFGCAFILVLFLTARRLAGPIGGGVAAGLAWFSWPVVHASVEARPYALVLLSVALAIAGFQWAIRTGTGSARALWILGGASVAWAHYVHYPIVVGLAAAYILLPDLRTKYSIRRFLIDVLWQAGLVGLCAPQVLALLNRRATLSWIDDTNYLVFVPLLLPVLPAIALGGTLGTRDSDRMARALRSSLWICMVWHVGVLELAALGGVNLLSARYFIAILVPALLLAGAALARVRLVEAAAALLGFAILTGGTLIAVKRTTGTFSGVGYDDWRGAVTELSARLRSVPEAPVLYRSGFVEEDVVPLGVPSAATLAPLRSPGRLPFTRDVTPLTFRWSHALREAYFAERLLPALGPSHRFFVLCARFGPEPTAYPDQFVSWVEAQWPAQFRAERINFGGVELIDFQRTGR